MSWLTLLDASFRGVPFQVESITDKGEKSLALHEYPYRPGAEVEDLGRKARVIPVKALFWGLSYKSGVEALVKALEKDGKGELVHPVFGSIEVCIRSWEVAHDAERANFATVSFEAVEAGPDNPFFAGGSARSLAEKARDALLSGLQKAADGAALGLMSTLGELAGKAASVKNAVLVELDGLLTVYDEGRQVVRTAVQWLDAPRAFVADLSACIAHAASGVSGLGGYLSLSRLSSALPRLDLATGRKSGDYATGVNAYGAAWVSGPVSDNVGRAEAVLAVRAPRAQATGPAAWPKQQRRPSSSRRKHGARPWPTPSRPSWTSPRSRPPRWKASRAMPAAACRTAWMPWRPRGLPAARTTSARACAKPPLPCSKWARPRSMPGRRW